MNTRQFRADYGLLIKQVRLRSLIDAPYAFGLHVSDEEAALPDRYRHQLAAQVGGQVPEWRDRCVVKWRSMARRCVAQPRVVCVPACQIVSPSRRSELGD